MKTFDYSTYQTLQPDGRGGTILGKASAKKSVTLVVRDGNRYGEAGPGDRVIVDAAELRNPTTMAALATEQEYEDLLEKKAARKKQGAAPKKSKITDVVEAGLARLAAKLETAEPQE
jgi:hypothetical protein